MAEIEFDAAAHTYTVDGVEIPSVTTILKTMGIIDTSFYTDAGAARGKSKHLALELLDRGTIDWEQVPDEWMPLMGAWIRWTGAAPRLAIEEPVYHPVLHYAGTPDRVMEIGGVRTIVDIKNGKKEGWHLLQCQMYAAMVEAQQCIVWYARDTKKGWDTTEAVADPEIPIAVMRIYGCLMK